MGRAKLLVLVIAVAAGVAACGAADEPAGESEPGPVEEPGDPEPPVDPPEPEDGEPAADDATDDEPTADDGPHVVAVNAPITDMVTRVMGDRGAAEALLPEGADHHTYEPSPADATALTEADLFFANGLGLNPEIVRLAEANLPADAPIVLLAEEAVPDDEVVHDDEHGHTHDDDSHGHTHDDDGDARDDEAGPNPHAWMNLAYAMAYVDVIADSLTELDPDGEDTYRENASVYRDELVAVDEAIAEAVDTVPEENRKVVTFHDSWTYFSPRYGLEQVAAVQPSDYSEPSAAEVREIIDQIRAEGVPAVFGSEQFPSGVLDAIAEETGATYVGDLSDERLPGEPGDPRHSYIGLMVDSARTIVEALGGDPAVLDPVDPAR